MTSSGEFQVGFEVEFDTSKPHSARMYDFYLGGKDWYPADEEAAERVRSAFPDVGITARANRGFMHRATRVLAAEYGIRQFVDIGTGIPTEPNLHQIAQRAAPECRVVYVDHDPIVLEHAHALMRSEPEGRTSYVQADLRHDAILDFDQLREVIDLARPVGLSLVALMHFVPDAGGPYDIVRELMGRLAPGSFLTLSHTTAEFDPEAWDDITDIYTRSGTPLQLRGRDEVARFFDGMELIGPGLSLAHEWRADEPPVWSASQAPVWAGVARKR